MAFIQGFVLKHIALVVTILIFLFGLWGGLQVQADRVNRLEENSKVTATKSEERQLLIWNRFELDRVERIKFERTLNDTNHSLEMIEYKQSLMNENIELLTRNSERVLRLISDGKHSEITNAD